MSPAAAMMTVASPREQRSEDQMTQAEAMTHTEDLRRRAGAKFTEDLDAAAAAAAAGDFRQAATGARQVHEHGGALVTAVLRDALAAGAGWWDLGEHLSMHPQEAYERYRSAREGLLSPAQQRPELAVVLTAGVAAEHDWDDAYGIDLDDLGAGHSLQSDPTVLRLRQAAELLREGIWIAVNTPGEYEGDGQADEDAVATQWTTVVMAVSELVFLREALALNAAEDGGELGDEDLDPLG
jgi:hypothetical protein